MDKNRLDPVGSDLSTDDPRDARNGLEAYNALDPLAGRTGLFSANIAGLPQSWPRRPDQGHLLQWLQTREQLLNTNKRIHQDWEFEQLMRRLGR